MSINPNGAEKVKRKRDKRDSVSLFPFSTIKIVHSSQKIDQKYKKKTYYKLNKKRQQISPASRHFDVVRRRSLSLIPAFMMQRVEGGGGCQTGAGWGELNFTYHSGRISWQLWKGMLYNNNHNNNRNEQPTNQNSNQHNCMYCVRMRVCGCVRANYLKK